ncbi:MAG TPA: helix-turn-helix domain-containing protein [Myxococcota bacterium]
MTEATHGRESSEGSGKQRRIDEGPKGGAATWYDVLEIGIDASSADVKKAYDRSLALVEGRNIGGYLMLDPLAAESARADVEAAFAVLGDAERRNAYDVRLREQGMAPAAAAGSSSPRPSSSSTIPVRASDDADSKDARELLAVADAQTTPAQPARDTQAPRSLTPTPSSSGLKFLAPSDEGARVDDVSDVFKTLPPERRPDDKRVDDKPVEAKRDTAAEDAKRAPIRFGSPTVAPRDSDDGAEIVREPVAVEPAVTPVPPARPAEVSAAAVVVTTPSGTPMGVLPDSGEIGGDVIKALRDAKGLSVEELAEATKIRKQYLKAIEEQDFAELPARVYLRGFLTQIARVLKVDRARLAEGYLLFVEKNGPKA